MNTRCQPGRRGATLVLIAFILAVLVGVLALALDVGYLCVVRSDLQACADSAALAGASGMAYGPTEAMNRATSFVAKNPVNGSNVVLQSSDVQLGIWDTSTRVFSPLDPLSSTPANAIRVKPKLSKDRSSGVSLFLARALGINSADVSASAIATFRSKDVALVLDYSGSMKNDSSLGVSRMSTSDVVNLINGMYQDLGSPHYGTMSLTPLSVTKKKDQKNLLSILGLTNVTYPYPSGSWNDYFDYVQNDATLDSAGYKDKYGYLTLINYWQAQQYTAAQTPDLWKAREQPITAVKDAVDVFLTYMKQGKTDDRAALIAYTAANGGAVIEMPLTSDLTGVSTACRHGQAGKYFDYTDMGSGIATARTELTSKTRTGTAQVMVLLSDGNANWYNHSYNTTAARNEALNQARITASSHIPIITISLGMQADTDLMQQIADITGGTHFVVPGGSKVSDYEDQLLGVFIQIAANFPLKLVD